MTIEEKLRAIRERGSLASTESHRKLRCDPTESLAYAAQDAVRSQADVALLLAVVEAVLKLETYTVYDQGIPWTAVDTDQLREAIERHLAT